MRRYNDKVLLKDGTGVPSSFEKNRVMYVGFNRGVTGIMRVDKVEHDGYGWRLIGMNICGEEHGAYAENCTAPSPEQMQNWEVYKPARRGSYKEREYAEVPQASC